MDIVRGLIVVLDFDGLPGHHAQHMRMILAAALVEHDRVLGNVEGAVAESIFYVDEDVGEIAVGHDYVLGFVHAFAGWILTHVDLRWLGSHAVELDGAVYRGHGRGINWRGCRSHCGFW